MTRSGHRVGVEVFQDGSSYVHLPEDLTLPHLTFSAPDLTTFCDLDDLGLIVTGRHRARERTGLECRVAEPDPWCERYGAEGAPRDMVMRCLAHVPFMRRPTILQVGVRRYKCTGCGRLWRQDTMAATEPGVRLSCGGMRRALEAVVLDHLTVPRAAVGLGVGWQTANTAILAEGKRLLIDDPARFDGVRVIGVDGHVWRYTRLGDKYVTVVIGLTSVREKTGPSRLLGMVEGRSKAVFKTWRDGVEVVAMDGFTGFKTAAAEELPDAMTVVDPPPRRRRVRRVPPPHPARHVRQAGPKGTTRSTRPAAPSTPAPPC